MSDRVSIDESGLLRSWIGRKVGIPEYYGGPNKLANPIVLLNGLGFDYRVMGAVPAGEVGTAAWRQGLVKDYVPGSLPDVMSRAYGLAKGDGINSNGIYFINLDPSLGYATRTDLLAVLDRLKGIITDYAGTQSVTSSLKVDLVCHSTGCLMVREALKYSGQYASITGLNISDHIRRIVTVNAPHQGTGLAKSDAQWTSNPDYGGLPNMIAQISDANTSRTILNGSVHIDFSELYYDNCSGLESALCWVYGQTADMITSVAEFATDENYSDFTFSVNGSLLGPYDFTSPWYNKQLSSGYPEVRQSILDGRTDAIKAQSLLFPSTYVPGRLDEYPRRSDGSYVEIVPYYSDNAVGITRGIADGISEGILKNVCDPDEPVKGMICRELLGYLVDNTKGRIQDAILGERPASFVDGALTLSVDPGFSGMLTSLRDGWMKSSDLLVEAKSQRWSLETQRRDESMLPIDALKVATTYKLHYSEAPAGSPWHTVLHAPLAVSDAERAQVPQAMRAVSTGAPLMGSDLFCGLDPICTDLMGRNRPVLYAGAAVQRLMPAARAGGTVGTQEIYTQSATLRGNFEVLPLIQSGSQAGVALQNDQGVNLAVVQYDPAIGTWIWKAGPNGGTVQILLEPNRRPQFQVQRVGDAVTVVLTTQDRRQTTVSMASTTDATVNLVVVGDGIATNPVQLVGTADPVDVSSAQAPVAWGKVRPILSERGDHEANTSRPWLWIANSSTEVQRNIQLTYYFTADPAQLPVVEMDYPRDLPVRQESLGGDLWAFHVTIPEVPVNDAWPQSGMQIRLHYGDGKWGNWVKTDDPSFGTRYPTFSENVVLRDAQGRVIWGKEVKPTATASGSGQIVPQANVSAQWVDGGANEANMIRPRLTITNTSSVALASGYHAKLTIAGWPGTATPVLDGYWHPGVEGAIRRTAQGEVEVVWTVAPNALEPGQTLPWGEWALHDIGFPALAKSSMSFKLEILDAQDRSLGVVTSDPSEPPAVVPSLTAQWSVGVEAEPNMVRPRLVITNSSSASLGAGYRAKLRISGWTGATPPTLEGYWHPGVEGTIGRDAQGDVAVEWVFGPNGLDAGQSVQLGEWALHEVGYPALSKTGFAYDIQIFDANGNVLLDNSQVGR